MSNDNQNTHPGEEGDVWGSMGLESDGQGVQSTEALAPDSGDSFYDGSPEHVTSNQNPEDEVLDIEASPKKKSKAGIYAAIAVVGIIVLVIVWTIFSKMMAVMSPAASSGNEQVVSTPAGDIRPLDAAQEQPVSLPGGALPVDAPAAAPIQAVDVEPAASQPVVAAQPVVTSAPVVTNAPVAAACAPSAAAVCPDASAKDREIAALQADNKAAKAKIAELESEMKKPVAAKPTTPKVAQSSSRVASGQNKVVRGKFNEQKPEVKAEEPKTVAVVQAVAQVTASPVAPVEKKEVAGLSNYRLRAIYPNTGEFKSAHLVDPAGKNVVVRVGDTLRTGGRVTAINVDDWRVITTDGEIR